MNIYMVHIWKRKQSTTTTVVLPLELIARFRSCLNEHVTTQWPDTHTRPPQFTYHAYSSNTHHLASITPHKITHDQLFIHVSSMQDPFSSILLDLLHVLNVYYHISRNRNKSMHINYKFMILCDVSISLGVIILSAFIRFVSQVVNVVMINIMNRKAQVRDRDTSKTNRNGL